MSTNTAIHRVKRSEFEVEAVLAGRAALDWTHDTLELNIVIRGVSKRHGLLQELADLHTDPDDAEVPVCLRLTPIVDATFQLDDANALVSPTEAAGGGDARSEGNHTSNGPTPLHNTHTHVLGAFSCEDEDYDGTGLPLYALAGNLDKDQLAEAAFQADLPECVIDLTRVTERNGREIASSTIYHYRGSGHTPVIQRITTAMRRGWLESLRQQRPEAV